VKAGLEPFLETTLRRIQLNIGDSQLLKTKLDTPCRDLLCKFLLIQFFGHVRFFGLLSAVAG
jgi:hypothetical protein